MDTVPAFNTSKKEATFTKIFNAIDSIDRMLYGYRARIVLLCSLLVVIIAPSIDYFRNDYQDNLTFLSTLLLLVILSVIFLSWISAWRDDDGNWTLKRAQHRIATIFETMQDTYQTTRTNSKDELLWKIGVGLVTSSIFLKSIHNISVVVRHFGESIVGSRWTSLRHFERYISGHYLYLLAAGLILLAYLWKTNPDLLKRAKREFFDLFKTESTETVYRPNTQDVQLTTTDLVVSAKRDDHIEMITANQSLLFNDFVIALNSWHPRNCQYEYEFQEKLYRHLKKCLPGSTIELEYPIGDNTNINRGRADVVINRTILIELKRDSSAGSIQRAKGQVLQYTELWKGKGPVILLLCDFDFEHAKASFTPTMVDLKRLNREAYTVVATV